MLCWSKRRGKNIPFSWNVDGLYIAGLVVSMTFWGMLNNVVAGHGA